MINVDLNISEALFRKLKALAALKGETSSLEDYLVRVIDDVVTREIMEAVGGLTTDSFSPLPNPRHVELEPVRSMTSTPQSKYYKDASEISDGLGDEYEDEDGESVDSSENLKVSTDVFGLANGVGGIREKDLEEDMDVEDQEHEAKAEALRVDVPAKAEDIFSSVLGVPHPDEPEYELDPRAARRRKTTKLKARVTPATDVY